MSTHTNAMPSKNKFDLINRKHIVAIVTIIIALVAVVAISINMANQSAVVAENSLAPAYSNALEIQYAQPFIDAQSNSVVAFGNALELQYAQPFINAQSKPVLVYGNALETQYAQPWLEEADLLIAVTGSETSLDCHSSLEMLYACNAGYGRP